jgi:hypothetical protein
LYKSDIFIGLALKIPLGKWCGDVPTVLLLFHFEHLGAHASTMSTSALGAPYCVINCDCSTKRARICATIQDLGACMRRNDRLWALISGNVEVADGDIKSLIIYKLAGIISIWSLDHPLCRWPLCKGLGGRPPRRTISNELERKV